MFVYNELAKSPIDIFFGGKMLGLKNENAGKTQGGGYTLKPIASKIFI